MDMGRYFWIVVLLWAHSGGLRADDADNEERQALVQASQVVETGLVVGRGLTPLAANRLAGGHQDELRPYLELDLSSRTDYDAEDGRRWRMQGRDLGLPEATWQLEWGQAGAYRWQYRQQNSRHWSYDRFLSPYVAVSNADFHLPAGLTGRTATGPSAWSAAEKQSLAAALQAVDLGVQRQQEQLALLWWPAPYWQVRVGYQQEHKQGYKATGAASGNPGGSALFLPEPIQSQTNRWEFASDYAQAGRRLAISYQLSLFSNAIPFLDYQNPFSWGRLENRLSTAPNNRAHTLKLDGAWRVSPVTALSGALSLGRMWQDQAFLPYSTAATAPSLPQTSLHGVVHSHMAQLAWHTRPAQDWTMALRYRDEVREDRSPVSTYQHITDEVGVAFPASTNTPRSRHVARTSAEAEYKLPAASALRVLAEQERIHRYCATGVGECTQVEHTREHNYRLEWRRPWGDDKSVRMAYLLAQRRGSQYLSLAQAADLAGLRKFMVADRDRQGLNIWLQGLSDELFSWSGQLSVHDDRYGHSPYGLSRARNWTLNLDGNWAFNDDFSIHGLLGLSDYYSRLDSSYATDTLNNVAQERLDAAWISHSRDEVLSLGLGAMRRIWSGRLELSADVLWLYGQSHNDMSGSACASNAGTSPCTGSAVSSLPDVPLRSVELRLAAQHALDSNSSLRLHYRYARLAVSDYAYDSIGLTSSTRVLGSNTPSPQYAGHLLSLGYQYRFR